MVATRRTAPTAADSDMPDPELALKKKPVRKATAKQTAKSAPAAKAATTAAAAKTKTTRGKKAEPKPAEEEPEVVEEAPKPKTTRGKKAEPAPVEEQPQVVEEAPKPKATRGRPKKTVEVAAEPVPEQVVEEPAKPTRSTKATKAGSVRGKKAGTNVEEDAPELPAPEEAKPARKTRATATKAAPLSPKKITQVTKPATRNAKAANQKPAAKTAPAKGPVRGRAASTRNRKVSDENADVPELPQPEEQEDDSVVVVSSTPVKKPVTRRQAAKKQEADETEISMSTRDTTPTASPAPSQHTDAGEEQVDEPSADLSTPEKQTHATDNEESDDELCGPKTPMRRGSPGAEARYHSSAQRTIRKYNEEQRMQTPARRYAVLGSQKGTPQTTKPYCKPAPPSSEMRPMTVARGANRAYVFKDLRDGAPELPQRQQQEPIAEEEDVSFIPDDNIISVGDEEEEEDAQMTTPSGPAPLQLASPPTSSTDVEDEEDDLNSIHDDGNVENASVDESDTGDMEEDPDATIITEQQHDANEPEHRIELPEIDPLETEDTVIINRPDQAEAEADVTMSTVDDSTENSVIHHEPATSPTPETMVWENVQPEQTITVNFDDHLSQSRTLPEPEATEVLDIASTLDSHLDQDNDDAEAGAAGVEAEAEEEQEQHDEPLQTEENALPMPTPTVDFNDYFDMTAAAEPTQVVDFAPKPVEDGDQEMQDPAEADTIDAFAEGDVEEKSGALDEIAADDTPGVDPLTVSELAQAHEDEVVDDQPAANDFSAIDDDDIDESEIPHYARSTFAFDARRKSLPATSMFTPVKTAARPNTSDGASMPRIANPFSHAWWARSRANSIAAEENAAPFRSRPSTSNGVPTASIDTPSKPATPAAKERYPIFAPRQDYVDHSQTVAPARFRDAGSDKPTTRRQTFHRAISGKTQEAPTPVKPSTSAKAQTPATKAKERYPALGLRGAGVDHSQTVAPPKRFQDPIEKQGDRRKTFHKAISGKTNPAPTPSEPGTPVTKTATPVATPKERYPALGARGAPVDHSQTVAPPKRFQDASEKRENRRKTFHKAIPGKTIPVPEPSEPSTPAEVSTPVATPKERYPAIGSRSNAGISKTAAPLARFQDPSSKPTTRRQTFHKAMPGKQAEQPEPVSTPTESPAPATATPQPQAQATPTTADRFPRLKSQPTYQDHAATVSAPRFQTPAKPSPLKRQRPATTAKPSPVRKAALRNSGTPMKTPLKAPAQTPGAQEPMTPHPAAPLRGVVALVEVYTLEGASASAPFTALLHRLGAKTTRVWNEKVTHVIFKDGSPTTLQRVRLHNKGVSTTGQGHAVHCVNSRWVSDCDAAGLREDEEDEAYAVDVEEVPRGGKRRRKSMEPSALLNVGGNIVRDRKSSLGRSSLGRASSVRMSESPAKKAKLAQAEEEEDVVAGGAGAMDMSSDLSMDVDKENSPTGKAFEGEDEEPATPAWISQPSKLVQMTAPMKRVRKLELDGATPGKKGKGGRRLTFWDGRVE